jgi:hypothetical protein
MNLLKVQQREFLVWVNHNYEWMKTKGFTSNQPYQHIIYEVLVRGEYNEEEKHIIGDSVRFLHSIGLNTYKRDWVWDKNGAELDWLLNSKT